MANTEIIDSVVDPSVLKQFADLVTASDTATGSMVKATQQANILNEALKGSKGFNEFNKQAPLVADNIEKISKSSDNARLSEIRLQQAREKAFDDYEKKLAKQQAAKDKATAKDLSDSAKRQAASDKEAVNDAKNMLKSQQNVEKARRPYNLLAADLERLRNNAKDLGAEFGTTSPQFLYASKAVKELDDRVKTIDATVGQSQRNIGNYGDAFGKAFGLIRQAAYILPGIGIAGIFNLLFDGLAKLAESLDQTQAKYKVTQELIKGTNAEFATQSQTVKLLVAEVQNQNTAGIRRQEIIEKLNEISPTYFGNLKNEDDIVKLLPDDYKRYNDALLLSSKIKAANTLIGKKYEEQLNAESDLTYDKLLNQVDLNGVQKGANILRNIFQKVLVNSDTTTIKTSANAIKYLSDTILKAQADLQKMGGPIDGSQIDIQERITNSALEYNKQLIQLDLDKNNKIADNDKKSYTARYTALKKSLADQVQILQYSAIQELNNVTLTADEQKAIQDKNNFEILKARQDYAKRKMDLDDKSTQQDIEHTKNNIQKQKDAAKLVIDAPGASLDTRLAALELYNDKSKELANIQYKQEQTAAGENAKSLIIAKDHQNKALIDLQIDYNAQYIKILEDEYNQQMGVARKHDTDFLNMIKTSTAQNNQQIAEGAKAQIDALDSQYAKSGGSYELYQAKRVAIQQNASDTILQNNIDEQNKIIAVLKAAGLDATQYEQKLASLEEQQYKEKEQHKTDTLRIESQLRKELLGREFDLATETLKGVQQVVDANYENQIKQLQAQDQVVDDTATTQKKAIDGSIQSSATKARKDAVIDAQTIQSKKQLSDQQKKIQYQEAVFNREASALNIAVSTAEAVAKIELQASILAANPLTAFLAPIALAQVPIALAIGAVQEAALFAVPLPQFAKGGKTKAGLSIWGEAGTELAIEPSGKSYLSTGAEIAKFPIGTQIISNNELTKYIAPSKLGGYTGGQQVPWREVISAINRNKPTQQKRPIVKVQVNNDSIVRRMSR